MQDFSKGLFVPVWVFSICAGIALEFVGRSLTNHPWVAQLGLTLGALIVIFGYFTFLSGGKKQSVLRRRNGVLCIVMGAAMVATSFIFKIAIPLIFG